MTQESVEVLRDRIVKLEADIDRLSKHDALTGLLNRVSFYSVIEEQRVAAFNAHLFDGALVEVMVHGMPKISGTLGRHAGDYVLSALAARLNQSAVPGCVSARMDQSQFAVFFPHVSTHDHAMQLADDVLRELSQPVEWLDRPLSIELAAGVSLLSESGRATVNLIQNAELALESAMLRGSMGRVMFNPEIARSFKRRNEVLYALQGCLEKNELSLRYQPVYDANSGALAGFEALMRMNCRDLGMVSPAEFIPVAESAGMISIFGAWALQEACSAAAHWPPHLTLAVNISPDQFHTGTLVADVKKALVKSGMAPNRLELEITESTLLVNSDNVLEQLKAIYDLGCSIVLDDFGTGYSSLSYLWKFPFSKLKLDKAFIAAMDLTASAKGVAQSIVGLANSLRLKITAEGIESETQAKSLRDLGVHYLQGFYFSPPVTEQDLAPLVLREFSKLYPSQRPSPLQAIA
nr:bifunctional diguanylate cyclase/phosphodiesterase [Aestuariivirga litoralis]